MWDVATNFLVSNITGKNYRITGQFSPDNIFFFRHLNKTESALYLNFKPTSQQLAHMNKSRFGVRNSKKVPYQLLVCGNFLDYQTPSATTPKGNQPCISSRISPHSVRPVHSAQPVMLLQRGLVGNE